MEKTTYKRPMNESANNAPGEKICRLYRTVQSILCIIVGYLQVLFSSVAISYYRLPLTIFGSCLTIIYLIIELK